MITHRLASYVAVALLASVGALAEGCSGVIEDSSPAQTTAAPSSNAMPCASDGGCTPAPTPTPTSEVGTNDEPSPSSLPDGIYVSPTGSDSAPGTPTAPLRTIATAISAAMRAHKTVFLCTPAVFTEAVTVTAGLELRGGADCANGVLTTDRATIAPAGGIPLTIRDTKEAVAISRVLLKAPDQYASGASSIGAKVINADAVSFERVVFRAGNGADGATPPSPDPELRPPPNAGNGDDAPSVSCDRRNAAPPCNTIPLGGFRELWGGAGVCVGEFGGRGGNGGNKIMSVAAEPGSAGPPAGVGGAPGLPGNDGSPGAHGAPAASGFGSVSSDGYIASNRGSDGQPGAPGGGGGGGAGGASDLIYSGNTSSGIPTDSVNIGGAGGEGGFGGCGGASGIGADAGGASIALLAVHSHVTVTSSIFDAASGGRGGDGASGAAGQPGGQGGWGGRDSCTLTGRPLASCYLALGRDGAPGGNGGKGGAGGAGGGGPSIAFLVTDFAPTTTAVTYNVGRGGKGGRSLGGDAADGITEGFVALNITDGGVR